jgi:hypothetical protein
VHGRRDVRLAELSSVIARERLDVDTVVGGQLAPTRWASGAYRPD